ncbi:type II secretion system GspH family protein [Patescibacteria group bacterium]|nr:type II secretion system GspH family protein [Patescibacteria group bacterium]MCL5797503.1 type II secretion system GspH family protein [Patescibacteria group bacterium]
MKSQISNLKSQIFGRLTVSDYKSKSIHNDNYGFTLLELLVVISIITVLIAMGLTSFSSAQKKGRDAKRKSDIKEVQSALEQYYSVCGYAYITPAGGGNSFFTAINCPTPPISIMPAVPVDPQGTPYYCGPTPGASNCTTSSYTVCTGLESESPNYFCVSNQQ